MRRQLVCAFAGIALLTVVDANARGVRIDFEDNNFDFSGQAWDTLQFVDVAGDANVGPIALGFQIDFGQGLVDSLFINENGYVSFGSAITFNGGIGTLSDLGENVVAPYYANVTSTTPPSGTFPTFEPQSVSYSTGQLQRVGPPFGDRATAPRAMRVTWTDVLDANGDPIQFQALFVAVGGGAAGDFDLEFNYGGTYASPTAAGFVLGTNIFSLGGPFSSATDYTFAFRGGVFGGTPQPPPVAVSEPGSLMLLLGGLVLLALRRQRRRA